MESVGEKFKKIRVHFGLNQEDFGKQFGVGKAFISSLENDNSKLSYGHLIYLLQELKVNLNWLLDDKNNNEGEMFITKEKPVLSKLKEEGVEPDSDGILRIK